MTDIMESLEGAISGGDLEEVKGLVAQGANVNAKISGSEGNSLFDPCENGDLSMVKFLLKAGADIEFKDESKQTPLMMAARAENSEPEEALAVVNYLIDEGADFNTTDCYGNTVLMHAAESGVLSIVQTLVDQGADAALENDDGETALSKAEEWEGEDGDYSEIIEYLGEL